MTLLTAFRNLGATVGDGTVDAIRSEAASVVMAELYRLARSVAEARGREDDAVSDVYWRQLAKGPRGIREGDPDTDERIRAFLRTCVRNAARDLIRGDDGHELPSHDGQPGGKQPADEGRNPEDELLAMEADHLSDWAAAEVSMNLIHDIAATLRSDARQAFVTTVSELRELAADHVAADDLIRRRGQEPNKQTRDALYQQHSRTRRRLWLGVERILESGRYPAHEADAIRRVVGGLKRRQ